MEAMNLKKQVCGSAKTKESMMIESVLCLLEYRFVELPSSIWKTPESAVKDPFNSPETALEIVIRGNIGEYCLPDLSHVLYSLHT